MSQATHALTAPAHGRNIPLAEAAAFERATPSLIAEEVQHG
jgi:hypothetical protein